LPISPKQKKKINREWWKRAQQQIPTAWPLRVNPGREEGEKKTPKRSQRSPAARRGRRLRHPILPLSPAPVALTAPRLPVVPLRGSSG